MRFTHDAVDRRTVTEIQIKIIEKKERNLLSQLAHAKNDKETIAAWKLDLIRILQVFNVRSVGPVLAATDSSFQSELTLNTHTIVSDIHRDMWRGHEDTGSKNQAVSEAHTLSITE